jgi:hypothetical protein
LTVAVGHSHGDGCTVCCNYCDGHIFERNSCIAGVGIDLDIPCRWQNDPSLDLFSYHSMLLLTKRCQVTHLYSLHTIDRRKDRDVNVCHSRNHWVTM